jgi:prepilin-type N-terminal cleavage/methylation domain-containing protein
MTMVRSPNRIQVPRRGYSLVEMLIVVVLIGIVSALVIPQMSNIRNGWSLDAAAQQLQSDLRRTQSEAIRRNVSLQITRVNDSTYRIDSLGVRYLPPGVKFDVNTTTATARILTYGPPQSGTPTYSVVTFNRRRNVIVNAVGRVTVSQETAR